MGAYRKVIKLIQELKYVRCEYCNVCLCHKIKSTYTGKYTTNVQSHNKYTKACLQKHIRKQLHDVHRSPNSLNIVFSDDLFDSGTAFSPGGRRSSVGSPLNTPIRPVVLPLKVLGAPTVMSSCSAFSPIVKEKPVCKQIQIYVKCDQS